MPRAVNTVQSRAQSDVQNIQPAQYQQPVPQIMHPTPSPAEKERAEIKSIGIWSMAKFNAVVLTIVGFVMVGVYTIMTMILNPLISGLAAKAAQGPEAAVIGSVTGSSSVPFLVPTLTPLIVAGIIVAMALWGLISGAVLAICYNIISRVIGGIEFTLQEK